MRVNSDSNSGNSFRNDHWTVGIVALTSPHNEKCIAKVNVEYLKEFVDLLDHFDEDTVYLWRLTQKESDTQGVAATVEKDSPAGIALAGIGEVHDE